MSFLSTNIILIFVSNDKNCNCLNVFVYSYISVFICEYTKKYQQAVFFGIWFTQHDRRRLPLINPFQGNEQHSSKPTTKFSITRIHHLFFQFSHDSQQRNAGELRQIILTGKHKVVSTFFFPYKLWLNISPRIRYLLQL